MGSQYAHLIARRIRELGAYAIITDIKGVEDILSNSSVKAVVLSGGPLSAREFRDGLSLCGRVLNLGIPVLGICLGHQLIAEYCGGTVEACKGEFGKTVVRVVNRDPLLRGWGDREVVWMSHRECVTALPDQAKALAVSESGYVAVFKLKGKPIYGVQFHPEVRHTPKGRTLLLNFLKIAEVALTWKPEKYLESILNRLKEELRGRGKALAAVSGGVDSTVAALLAKRIAGDHVIPVFVDHGLFREEVEEVVNSLKALGLEPLVIDARERFLRRLEGVADCEVRRRIIGEEFARAGF